ncbi:MAG: hypothetical protein LBD73_03995, partial [Deferribacteraceae bacterium]|nr:hypothetical protein [Deferribacteraceae bacterium]
MRRVKGTLRYKAVQNIHPLVKFTAALALMVSLGIAESLPAAFIFLILLFMLTAITSPSLFLAAVKPFSLLFVFTFAVQLFITVDGGLAVPDLTALTNAVFFT